MTAILRKLRGRSFAQPLPLLSSLVLLLVLSLSGSPARAQAPDLLLSAPAPAGAAATALPSSALRANTVTINQPVLAGITPGAKVRMELFADRAPTVTFDRRDDYPSLGHVWVGHIEGELHSEVHLSEVNGSVALGLRSHGKPFVSMRSAGDSSYVVYEAADQPDFCPGGLAPPAGSGGAPAQSSLGGSPEAASAAETHIDVAAFYTDVARIAAGGTPAIQAVVLAAFASANQGHANSGSEAQLRLVHLEEIIYDESGDLGTHLDAISNPAAGIGINIDAKRNTYGADLVALFVDDQGTATNPSTIGLAWRPGQYSVTKWDWAVNITLVHEIGHNMGLCHDAAATPDCYNYDGGEWTEGTIPHDHGYRLFLEGPSIFCDDDCAWNSIMYSTISSDGLNRFSDPDLVLVCQHDLCSDSTGAFGNATTADNQRVVRDYRSRSANEKQPNFWVHSLAGDGNATHLTPENDVADVYDQWFPLTEPDPATNADVYILPANYPAPLFIDEKSTLRRWGTTGSVVLGQ